MRTDELDYNLPHELIAQEPSADRSQSRLMVLDKKNGEIVDSSFSMLCSFLKQGDLLVINDTKVLPARFFARRKSGARLEGLFLHQTHDNLWQVMLKGVRKLKTGEKFWLLDKHAEVFCEAQLSSRDANACLFEIDTKDSASVVLKKIGFAPLPPYIKRDDDLDVASQDIQRYQTIYAKKDGAVAAPTAGLHFSEEIFDQLKKNDISIAKVTLHVGAGTFKPVTEENLENHQIHHEYYSIDQSNAEIINNAKSQSRRIIAVGTTSVRTLETVGTSGLVKPACGMTDLFILPGFEFKIIDAMITNFHLPKSTLLALVGAFAGMDKMQKAYRHAIEQQYRFYSYGDAMLIS
ncbi:MAG: tRNA preQ1(34) S-adenosylmethionine ribosyltransferase-isomerase QueA [Phycisphaerae bacterium]|nr:tRNA preQ1(34) S-adenosylmethionine ribosyltransferase-isomerase QueA [Phycisphaerae bacterium]